MDLNSQENESILGPEDSLMNHPLKPTSSHSFFRNEKGQARTPNDETRSKSNIGGAARMTDFNVIVTENHHPHQDNLIYSPSNNRGVHNNASSSQVADFKGGFKSQTTFDPNASINGGAGLPPIFGNKVDGKASALLMNN